jgi:undecaprenyl-diphosphatase
MVWALYTRSRANAMRARDAVLVYFTALFFAETLVKPLLARARPSSIAALATRVHLLGARPSAQSYSLPSGTATACAAVAVWVWLAWGPRAGLTASTFAVAVAWSRLYAGVHWPSDLVAGALLGGAVAHAVRTLGRWIDAAPRSSS